MMPYVTERDREDFNANGLADTPGKLAYAIGLLLSEYILLNSPSFRTYNDMHGVLSTIDKELYARETGRYEDGKRIDNGSIWPRDTVSP